MSKEEERYLQREVPQGLNQQPHGAYPGQTYSTIVPNTQPPATTPGQLYPSVGQQDTGTYNGQQPYNTGRQPGHGAYAGQPVAGAYAGQPYGGVGQPTAVPPVHRIAAKKSIIEAYLLWLILGPIGAHHFYLRRPGFGVLYFFTFGLAGFGFLFDLFRMPWLVKRANETGDDPKERNKRNISDAYTLWFPFGLLGFHHFYLNRPGFGVLYLFTGGICGLGWLVDLFRIPSLVRQANEDAPSEKTKCTAYLLGLSPVGILGPHHFYLNRPLVGLMYILTVGNFGVGWIVDWFRMPALVRRANKEITDGPQHKRYLDDAYLLWFPLGLLGVHHFYLNRPAWGIVYFFTLGLAGVGWLIDGCRMSCLVNQCNNVTDEKRRVPTTYILTPDGYGQPVVPGHVSQPTSGVYGSQQTYGTTGYQPIEGSNPQPYQYPPQQAMPSHMEQPPPYSPPK